jgi:hypothetical protein
MNNHHQTHIALHTALCELIWDFIMNNPGSDMGTNLLEFLRWSSKQVDHKPDHPERVVNVRRTE